MSLTFFGDRLHCAIFCGPGTLEIAHAAYRLYQYKDLALEIVFVCPRREMYKFSAHPNFSNSTILADEDLPGFYKVSEWLQSRKELLIQKGRSPAWYLQQYLKLAYCWNKKGFVFVHDGDTIFSPNLISELLKTPFLFVTNEQFSIYNKGCKRLKLTVSTDESFIANGGLFYGEKLRDLGMIDEWFINAIEYSVLASEESDFSEYQIMGQLLYSNKKYYLRKLKFFRRFDLLSYYSKKIPSLEKLVAALNVYDAIAFERNHKSSFVRYLAAKASYWFQKSW